MASSSWVCSKSSSRRRCHYCMFTNPNCSTSVIFALHLIPESLAIFHLQLDYNIALLHCSKCQMGQLHSRLGYPCHDCEISEGSWQQPGCHLQKVVCRSSELLTLCWSVNSFLLLLAAGIGRSEGATKESTRAGLHTQVPLHFWCTQSQFFSIGAHILVWTTNSFSCLMCELGTFEFCMRVLSLSPLSLSLKTIFMRFLRKSTQKNFEGNSCVSSDNQNKHDENGYGHNLANQM
jgi:hypothetical protein